MTKRQKLTLIFNSVHFSRDFLFCFVLFPKHPFILRLSFLLKIPRFIGVLSKMD